MSSEIVVSARPAQRVFGRRKGRPLRVRKSRLMETLLPRLQITLPEGGALQRFDPQSLFAAPVQDLWCEIGFGGGEHLVAQAERHPEIGFIGCEPFVNGVASLLDHIDQRKTENIRVFADDARRLLDALPDGCLGRVYVLFADPWPKARHAERRFIGFENLGRLARVMKAGAELRLATDDANLNAWMRGCLPQAVDFVQVSSGNEPPADWIATRYEQKALKAGRTPVYLSYRRR